jgi:putative transposase
LTAGVCVIHLLRNTFRYAARQNWDANARDIKPVYTAPTAAAAAAAARFDEFADTWGSKYPAAIRLWRIAWEEFTPFLSYDADIRRVICTTNAIWVFELTCWPRRCFPDWRSARRALTLNAIDAERAVVDSKCRARRVSADSGRLA